MIDIPKPSHVPDAPPRERRMTNADKFKSIFGIYATELWAKSEEDFLEWLNSETEEQEKANETY